MKLNNKGMAISGILYSILVLFIVLVFGILSLLASTKYSFDKFKSDIQNKLNGDIDDKIDKTIYTEAILKGTDPVLDFGMIPAVIDDNGKVTKADIFSDWYSYEEKRWANAVLVHPNGNLTRDEYIEAPAGTIIDPYDILGYIVWIPRYRYNIPTGGTSTPSSINIIFENNTKNKSNGDAVSTYYTHPAFTFGDVELNGIWVGKFETTGTADKPTVLPNEVSLRNQDVSTQFATAKKFNEYGLINSDAHMMKNSEWGAVAYLSHSTYGLNGKVRNNNNSSYKTGCGALLEADVATTICRNSYGSVNFYPQSTTGNITGIFDMSGGANDRVMGNFSKNMNNSGFTEETFPTDKYIDIYTTSTGSTACNDSPCISHALYETNGWYGESTYYPNVLSQWFVRGNVNNSRQNSGIFYSNGLGANATTQFTFRLSVS